MSIRSLGFLACRLLALYFIFKIFEPFARFIERYFFFEGHRFSESSDNLLLDYPMLLEIFILLLSSIILWFGANALSKFLSVDKANPKVTISLDETSLQSVAISSLGLFFVAKSLAAFVALFIRINKASIFDVINDGPLYSIYSVVTHLSVSQTCFEILFGLLLLFGAGRMSHMLIKWRYYGLEKKL